MLVTLSVWLLPQSASSKAYSGLDCGPVAGVAVGIDAFFIGCVGIRLF